MLSEGNSSTSLPSNVSSNVSIDWTHYHETIAFERIVGTVIPIIFGFAIIIGLVGNVLVILVIWRNTQMQNSTNTLIINLAIADLLFLMLCVPFTAADYAMPVWTFSEVWCKLMLYLQPVSAYASVWTLVLMALDRYLAVVFPVPSVRLRTVRNTMALVALCWVTILVTNIPYIHEGQLMKYRFYMENRSMCGYVRLADRSASPASIHAMLFSFNAFGYVVPLAITLALYMLMLRKLWFHMPAVRREKRSQEAVKNKRKVTYMVSAVTAAFATCWLPFNVCFFITGITYTQHGRSIVYTKEFFVFQVVSQTLAYTNSCLNPILYAFLSSNFRKAFAKVFTTCQNCIPGSPIQRTINVSNYERTDAGPTSSIRASMDETRRRSCLIPSILNSRSNKPSTSVRHGVKLNKNIIRDRVDSMHIEESCIAVTHV